MEAKNAFRAVLVISSIEKTQMIIHAIKEKTVISMTIRIVIIKNALIHVIHIMIIIQKNV